MMNLIDGLADSFSFKPRELIGVIYLTKVLTTLRLSSAVGKRPMKCVLRIAPKGAHSAHGAFILDTSPTSPANHNVEYYLLTSVIGDNEKVQIDVDFSHLASIAVSIFAVNFEVLREESTPKHSLLCWIRMPLATLWTKSTLAVYVETLREMPKELVWNKHLLLSTLCYATASIPLSKFI